MGLETTSRTITNQVGRNSFVIVLKLTNNISVFTQGEEVAGVKTAFS